MNKETLNIAILPSDDVASQAIEMSKKIASEIGSRFVLNLNSLIPHITMYQAQYPSKNMDKLKDVAKGLSMDQESFEIKFEGITVSHETFLFWKCEKSPVLQNFQNKAVELANPLREGCVPDSLKDVTGLSEGDKYDVEHFGALLIGPRYEPHITVTRLCRKNDAEKAIKILSDTKELSFRPKGLILGYLGEHGTVTEIIENYRFK